MNAEPSIERTTEASGAGETVGVRPLIRFVLFAILVPGILFLAAGSLRWSWAWRYYAMLVLSTLVSRLFMVRKHPDLAAERAQYRDKENAKPWDRFLVSAVALYGPLATWIVAGLDFRFGWSPTISPALRWASAAVVALGTAFASWAMVVNRFFAAVVRIQDDRGHEVVGDGPYRLVRHPGYAGGVWAWLATPLMLGALWAYVPALLTAALLVVRTALEDRTLIRELAGYDEYAKRTRYRLLPGIW